MTTSKVNIRVDSINNKRAQNLQEIQIEFSFQKQKVQQINKKICQFTGQNDAPFLFIQFPSIQLTQFIHKQQPHKEAFYQFQHLAKNNKHYYCGNFKSVEMKKFVSNLQKAFIKLNELDNWGKFQISFSEGSEKKSKQNLWQNGQLKGQAKIDSKFVPLLKELLQKVSPKFIDSPLIILLQQLQSIDLDLNLKTFQLPQFIEQAIKKYVKIDLLANQKLLKKVRQSKQQIVIRITLGHLFSLKIKGGAFLTLLKFL